MQESNRISAHSYHKALHSMKSCHGIHKGAAVILWTCKKVSSVWYNCKVGECRKRLWFASLLTMFDGLALKWIASDTPIKTSETYRIWDWEQVSEILHSLYQITLRLNCRTTEAFKFHGKCACDREKEEGKGGGWHIAPVFCCPFFQQAAHGTLSKKKLKR